MSPRPRGTQQVPLPASKTQIDRAGRMLREWWNNTNLELEAEYAEAAGLMVAFREGFQEPLRRVTMGVRSMVATENAPVIVSQRLKRAVTIVHKLSRLQSTRLSQMQDIGGCRAILPDREHVERVVRRMRRNSWEIKALDDYWLNPKPTATAPSTLSSSGWAASSKCSSARRSSSAGPRKSTESGVGSAGSSRTARAPRSS